MGHDAILSAAPGENASNFNQLSHECRVDTGSDSYPVLTFMRTVRNTYGTSAGLEVRPAVGWNGRNRHAMWNVTVGHIILE